MAGSGGMSPNTARRLAAMIVRDAEQLQENSETYGVTAFLGRAVQRERPNERFLQNTIRNLASSNRRADERQMWAAWEAHKEKEREQQQQERISRSSRGRGASPSRGRQRQRCDKHSRSNGGRSRERSPDRLSRHTKRRGRSSSPDELRKRSRVCVDEGQMERQGRQSSREPRGERNGARHHSTSSSRSRSRSRAREHSSQSRSVHAATVDKHQQLGVPTAAVGGLGASCSEVPDDSGGSTVSTSSSEGRHDYHQHDRGDDDDGFDLGSDEHLVRWLASSKSVRGRGSIGPNADMPGPFLEAPPDAQQLQLLREGVRKGPERPEWMQKAEAPGVRAVPNAGFLQGVLRAQGIAAGGLADGSAKTEAQKQAVQKHSRKHVKRKTKRHRSSDGDLSSGRFSGDSGGSERRQGSGKRKDKKKRSKHKHKHKKKRHRDNDD